MTPRCTYLFPIGRVRPCDEEMEDLAEYFHMLNAAGCEVLVVDASPPDVFALHDEQWDALCRHVPLDSRYHHPDDKVNAIHTGIDLAAGELIIVGEDDIRYTWNDIDRMCVLLERHEMVLPQNYLSSLPWWACIEAAGMLINRRMLATGDSSGTFAFRRSTMVQIGHYDGDALFDAAHGAQYFALKGAKVVSARSFFVQKEPPALHTWLEQRPYQALKELGTDWERRLFLALPPVGVLLGIVGGWVAVLLYGVVIGAVSIALASLGRREGAQRFFPESIPLWAPLWVLERSISLYLALYLHVGQGEHPFSGRVGGRKEWHAWVARRRVPLHATEGTSGKSGK